MAGILAVVDDFFDEFAGGDAFALGFAVADEVDVGDDGFGGGGETGGEVAQ